MSGVKTGSPTLIAILAAIVLPCAGIAQMHAQAQQTVYPQSTSATPSGADPNSSAASPAGVSGGASSWTSGKGSFGITAKTAMGSTAGATGGSWVAGSGEFGMKSEPGGIWHESGGGSMESPNTAPSESSAAKGFVAAALPGLVDEVPSTAASAPGARPGGILASRSPGGHSASGAGYGASGGFRSGSRSMGGKPASLSAHHHAGTESHAGPGHAGPGHGSGAGSSSSHAKAHSTSAFTSSGSSTMGGMH